MTLGGIDILPAGLVARYSSIIDRVLYSSPNVASNIGNLKTTIKYLHVVCCTYDLARYSFIWRCISFFFFVLAPAWGKWRLLCWMRCCYELFSRCDSLLGNAFPSLASKHIPLPSSEINCLGPCRCSEHEAKGRSEGVLQYMATCNALRIYSTLVCLFYEGVSKSFRTESITKSTTTINTRWEATQRVMAAKLTRLTHKITINCP
jgi:hypothetical protein